MDDILEEIYRELNQIKDEVNEIRIKLTLMIDQRKITLPIQADAYNLRVIENTITKTSDHLSEVMITFSSYMEDRKKKSKEKKVYLVKDQKNEKEGR